jgi:hypothetical protein
MSHFASSWLGNTSRVFEFMWEVGLSVSRNRSTSTEMVYLFQTKLNYVKSAVWILFSQLPSSGSFSCYCWDRSYRIFSFDTVGGKRIQLVIKLNSVIQAYNVCRVRSNHIKYCQLFLFLMASNLCFTAVLERCLVITRYRLMSSLPMLDPLLILLHSEDTPPLSSFRNFPDLVQLWTYFILSYPSPRFHSTAGVYRVLLEHNLIDILHIQRVVDCLLRITYWPEFLSVVFREQLLLLLGRVQIDSDHLTLRIRLLHLGLQSFLGC